MADFRKLGKGVTGALAQANEMAKAKRVTGESAAADAIGKAAESAGMKAPVTADKPLTNLQDFHTSFGDSVRKRAADMQAIMDSFNYKYDKGQRVFTEDSARKNWPPMTVLGRVLEGNRIMREDPSDFLSKKIIDEATGKAKRTPHEPGYKVRLEHSPDNWSEFVIPESAIKGNVDMANGGAMRMPPKKTEGFEEEKPKDKSVFDKVRQAVRQVPKVATSPLGVGLNAGYAGYKYLTGEDPLEDLRKKLDAKLNPPINTGQEPVQQFEKFADGGKIGKGLTGALTKAQEIARARKAADMMPTARINLPAPGILIPSKLNNVRELVRQSKGNYGARRVERAADEIPNLEKMYKEDALKEAFFGENASGVMTMNPADFEKFAIELSKKTSVGPKAAELAKQGEIDKYTVPTDEYIKYLQQVGGFDYLPYLNLFKDEVGLPTKASIVGHEGRHRSRALADKGETASLVQMIPRGDLREGMPRRTQEDFIEALKEELDSANRLVLPEVDGTYRRPPVELPDIYAEGGGVKHMADAGRVSRGVTGALTKAKEMAQAKKASESKIAEVLEAKQAPMTRPQGTGLPLMPRDQGMYTPREQ
jgi:hypothetical protein